MPDMQSINYCKDNNIGKTVFINKKKKIIIIIIYKKKKYYIEFLGVYS